MNEAELVYSHILNCDRLSLYLNKDACLDPGQSAEVSGILKRRIQGEPLAYILGTCEFMGWEFRVDQRVLIPRPETEVLVIAALDKIKSSAVAAPAPKILDLGTGSGCIAISLAKLLPLASLWATDISLAALQLAENNAAGHQVKIKFLHSDLFQVFAKNPEKFDLIISNPPYIASDEFCALAKEVYFEPALALKGGSDGLDFYRRIIKQAAIYLNNDGFLALETGAGQAGRVCALLEEVNFNLRWIIKDYNNIERVVLAQQRI